MKLIVSLMVKFSLISIGTSSTAIYATSELSESEAGSNLIEQFQSLIESADCEKDNSCLVTYDKESKNLTIDKGLEAVYETQRSGLIELANIVEQTYDMKLDRSLTEKSFKDVLQKEVDQLDQEDMEKDAATAIEMLQNAYSQIKIATNDLLAKM
ncbi:hypothetical protein [Vibrio harveyi]|uniref:hypothetical protein n=1 Tax=Vibrio harveyi TaxID=669 RepID=UPI00238013AC|nr:hypothetical protein [Vibrio harveyi]